jgi:hypothetical protein
MANREERSKLLLGDTNNRTARGQALLASDIPSAGVDEDFTKSLLERRKERLIATNTTQLVKKPTFKETQSKFLQTGKERKGIAEVSTPVTFSIPKPNKEVSNTFFSARPDEKVQAKRDLLSTFLFGKGSDKPLGQEATGIIDSAKEAGVVGFLYSNILKSNEQRQAERYEKLVGSGVEPERAYQIATAWARNGALPTDVTKEESSAMKWHTTFENAFIALELADLLFVGKPINTGLKALSRGAQHQLFVDIARSANAKVAREIITSKYPQLANTEGVNELIDLAFKTSETDNWRKVLADTKTGKTLLSGEKGIEAIIPTTQAQKIVYKNGVPILQATPTSSVDELVAFRDEVREVLRGAKEESRLSNADILADEIKAGSLPFKQASDGTVEVFATRNIARLRNGERVSLSEELATDALGGIARKFTANVDDLVRFEDGTFAYAPKRFINESAEPTLRAIRKEKQEAVRVTEQTRRDEAIKLAKAEERAAKEESEAVVRKAKKDAEAKSLQEAEVARVAKEVEENSIKYKAQTRANTKERLVELKARFDAPNIAIRNTTKEIVKLTDSIKKADGEMKARLEKKLETAREALAKAEGEKMSAVEYETKKERIRVEAKKEIAKVNAEVRKVAKSVPKIKEKAEIKEVSTADTIVKVYKESEKVVSANAKTQGISPVKSEGEKVKNLFTKKITDEVSEIAKREGVELQDLPLEHRVASNPAQVEKAFDIVSNDPELAYRKFISDGFDDETTKAAIFNVLTKGDFFKGDRSKMDNIIRAFYKQGTRIAQEMQARTMIGALDYTNIVAKLIRKSDEVLKSKGVKMDKEIEKISDALGTGFDTLKVASKSDIVEIITEKTCKIDV